MTVAVCTECGAMKWGALTPCEECGFSPRENEDKAKAMALTDHWVSEEELKRISEKIGKGEPISYPQEMIDEYTAEFERNPGFLPLKFKVGCAILGLLFAGLVIGLALKFL